MSQPLTWPGGSTRLAALLGDPVAHSLSPQLHNTVFRGLGFDVVYVALRVAPADLASAIAGLGAVGALGANVTVPHKRAAYGLCAELTAEARLVGAVNTLSWRDGALYGTTTDTTGLGRVLGSTVPGIAGSVCVVLGTGGAARAAVVALGRAGAAVAVIGRDLDAARLLSALATTAGAPSSRALDLSASGITALVRDARVVLNATTLGMAGESLPAAFMELHDGQIAHDLVYGHGVTPFVAAALDRGVEAHDGTAMLVAQAADAFEVWTGGVAPVGSYEAALGGAASVTFTQ
ncbi:MAG: shikimate dehydrogenase [Myxococcota bacterium]